LRRISLACRSSRFSRSSAFSLAAKSVGTPARRPSSTSAFFTHSLSVCAVQPILAAIDMIAAHRDECSPSWSTTIRTARARTSGENLLLVCFVIAPPSQELEPPINPGRFTPPGTHSSNRGGQSAAQDRTEAVFECCVALELAAKERLFYAGGSQS